jgi:hypothetical protein
MVSEYTEEDANSFGEGARPLRGADAEWGAGKKRLDGQWLHLTKTRTSQRAFFGHVMNNAAFRSIVEHS